MFILLAFAVTAVIFAVAIFLIFQNKTTKIKTGATIDSSPYIQRSYTALYIILTTILLVGLIFYFQDKLIIYWQNLNLQGLTEQDYVGSVNWDFFTFPELPVHFLNETFHPYVGTYTSIILWIISFLLAVWVFTSILNTLFTKEIWVGRLGTQSLKFALVTVLIAFILALFTTSAVDRETVSKRPPPVIEHLLMNQMKVGAKVEVTISPATIVKVWLPEASQNISIGKSPRVCVEIVEPRWLIENEKDTPTLHAVYLNELGEARTYQRKVAVDEDMKGFLGRKGVTSIKLEFTLIEVERNSKDTCPHSKA